MVCKKESFFLTVENFKESGWEEAFRDDEIKYFPYFIPENLSKKAQKASEEGKIAESKVLWLLADVCSMQLNNESVNKPFKFYCIFPSGRSSDPNYFSKDEIDYFLQILPFVSNSWLKARLSDLCWLQNRSNIDLALTAIDSYIETPIRLESFRQEGLRNYFRALQLASILKECAKERIKSIEDKMLDVIFQATDKDGFLVNWICSLLERFKLGVYRANEIAEKLISLAKMFESNQEFNKSAEYYKTASSWFLQLENKEDAYKAIAFQAQVYYMEGTKEKSYNKYSSAADRLEKSIQVYRLIPNKYKILLGIGSNQLENLRRELNETNELALEELQTISSGPIDITEIRNEARSQVKGKKFFDALKILANFYPGTHIKSLKNTAEQALTEFHISSLANLKKKAQDGRTVAKSPATFNLFKGTPKDEKALWKEILTTYFFEIGTITLGKIFPALEMIIIEHDRGLQDFYLICSRSSIVPPRRALAFSKAIYSGYDMDFDSAIHRIVPQIENLVRYHLQAAGTITTTFDSNGVEMQISLSSLLDKPEAIAVFGENLVFEMKALFCDKLGPNFRNNFAHGLFENEDFQSAYAVYIWSFTLRLIFNVFWNTSRITSDQVSSTATES